MPRTIRASVEASGHPIVDSDLVNFGSQPRQIIDPSTGPRSYWFRYGDIREMTLPQIQAAIGDLASAGVPGRVRVMRVSDESLNKFVQRSGSKFFGLDEYTIDTPVQVRWNIDVL